MDPFYVSSHGCPCKGLRACAHLPQNRIRKLYKLRDLLARYPRGPSSGFLRLMCMGASALRTHVMRTNLQLATLAGDLFGAGFQTSPRFVSIWGVKQQAPARSGSTAEATKASWNQVTWGRFCRAGCSFMGRRPRCAMAGVVARELLDMLSASILAN